MINDALMDAFLANTWELQLKTLLRDIMFRAKKWTNSVYVHTNLQQKQLNLAFQNEILKVELNGQILDHDESIRPDTSLEALSNLKPVFKEDGQVTAGNSSPLNDGASMLVLATKERWKNCI